MFVSDEFVQCNLTELANLIIIVFNILMDVLLFLLTSISLFKNLFEHGWYTDSLYKETKTFL